MDKNKALELTNIFINTGLNQIEDDRIQKIYLKAINVVLNYKNVQKN